MKLNSENLNTKMGADKDIFFEQEDLMCEPVQAATHTPETVWSKAPEDKPQTPYFNQRVSKDLYPRNKLRQEGLNEPGPGRKLLKN